MQRLRNFHLAYVESEKLAPLVREFAWSHNLLILERCEDPQEIAKSMEGVD